MRAHVIFRSKSHDYYAIQDADDGSMSITNDADAVVDHLVKIGQLSRRQRLIYLDSDGFWDEIVHDGRKFLSFRHIHARVFEQAVNYIRSVGAVT